MKRVVEDNKANPTGEVVRCRNVAADVVGIDKANTIEYDEVGSEAVTGGTTLKVETSPGGQEIFTTEVSVGDIVYWGIKRA